jgi:signal transduction histidine kinase/ligand-binding sensor domain-containing protein
MLRRATEAIAASAAFWAWTSAHPALAAPPSAPFGGYIRTHYSAAEGLPANVIDGIQETPDGFVWLIANGNGSALTRFDGSHFDVVVNSGVSALAVAPGGDLWLGTDDGLKRVRPDTFRYFDADSLASKVPGPGPASHVRALRFDTDGALWVGTDAGLFRFMAGRFTPIGPRVSIVDIEVASNGHILFTTAAGLVELDRSGAVLPFALAARLGTGPEDVYHVLQDRRGDVVYSTAYGVVRQSGAHWEKLGDYGPVGHAAFRSYEDALGQVWIAKAEGLFRITPKGLEAMAPGMQVRALCGDRNGDLWVGTNGDGLYRFQVPRARMYTTDDGLPNDVIMTVLAAHDGTVWAGANCGGLVHLDGGRFRTYNEKDGLGNSCVWSLAEDANRDLWIGTWGGGAFRFHGGSFTQVLAGDIVTDILSARDSSLWFATRNGVVRLRHGDTRRYTRAQGLGSDTTSSVYEDRAGQILVGSRGGVDRMIGDRFERFAPLPAGKAIPTGEDRTGALFVNIPGQPYAIRFQGGHVDSIPELGQEIDLAETSGGDLWFAGGRICRVPAGALARVRRRDEPLDVEWLGPNDGLASAEASVGLPNMTLGPDGTLWIATPLGLAALDSRHAPRTADPVMIFVRHVTVGRETRPASRELSLPPGTHHVEIDFAAVETSAPEKIQMQYRLDGVDTQWLDAGPDRRATYSNIPIGKHALRIRACNRSGIWDHVGTAYLVIQEPHFYQTPWFLVLALMIGLLTIVLVHRWRVRLVARRLRVRFDERLAERTRVARDLHDTFLQTVQGSKLVADHALKHPDDHARLLRSVEQLAGWLGRATEEARSALNSLRTSVTETNDLGEAFRVALAECRAYDTLQASVSVVGGPKELHPVVREEIYRIGYEAIRNACAHARARSLKILVEYGHDLTLRIVDDGVGMDQALVEGGKAGHFGLTGMRERAERIGGKWTLSSSPRLGTAITVVVPGRLAYRTRADTGFGS